MSLSASASFISKISGSLVKVAELYEIEIQTGETFYYTSHSKNILWGSPSQTYTALPITRTPIETKINLEAQTTEPSIQNISGDLFDLVEKNILDAARLTIKRINWDTVYGDSMEITVFVGFVNVEFDRQILKLKGRSILSSLAIQVPKDIYQEPCNKTLYDAGCGISQSDRSYAGAATSDGADNFTLRDSGLTVYKVAFDAGDDSNRIDIADSLSGDSGGDGTCVNIVYLTSSTGLIWYVDSTQQFVDDEVITGGGNTVTVNGTPAQDNSLYEMGELKMITGNNSGIRRMIKLSDSSVAIVSNAFPNIIETGDDYFIYPGCDKTDDDCGNVFNNEASFAGFLYVPKIQETIM